MAEVWRSEGPAVCLGFRSRFHHTRTAKYNLPTTKTAGAGANEAGGTERLLRQMETADGLWVRAAEVWLPASALQGGLRHRPPCQKCEPQHAVRARFP